MEADFSAAEIPPLPSYVLQPRGSLIPNIPDKYFSLISPIIAYWILSMIFHYVDELDLFPQYRLHTPAEVLKRNRVSRWEVIRDVVIQQVIQTIVGIGLAALEEDEFTGKDDYHLAVWGQRIRLAQRAIPSLLAIFGFNPQALALRVYDSQPTLAGMLAGGQYPWLVQAQGDNLVPKFAVWEEFLASALYWVVVPAFQFLLGIVVVDTWQYFLHRAMHMNKWLYTTFHSRHHRLYVPYAYGALYNHPFEGFLLDTVGTALAYLLAGLSPRQGICFFTMATIKTVDDHCGYALPWDPLQHITSNNAGYHDVHHQSWGIKTNFSQPFFTFWDRFMGTAWAGGDVSARYEKARRAAEARPNGVQGKNESSVKDGRGSGVSARVDEPKSARSATQAFKIPSGKASAQASESREQVMQDSNSGGPNVLREEAAEEIEVRTLRHGSRRKRISVSSPSTQAGGSLKGLRERVRSFHGRTGGVLGYESTSH